MWYTTGSGCIELQMTLAQARSASHPGQCDRDVLDLSRDPKIARQLRKIDPATLRAEMAEYGAWGEAELSDHDANLQRLVWLAACDISEAHPMR
jgi:hypothetical protein